MGFWHAALWSHCSLAPAILFKKPELKIKQGVLEDFLLDRQMKKETTRWTSFVYFCFVYALVFYAFIKVVFLWHFSDDRGRIIKEWSKFKHMSYCKALLGTLSDTKEAEISLSVSQTLLMAFTVNLELVCNTLHASHVSVFALPVTPDLAWNT